MAEPASTDPAAARVAPPRPSQPGPLDVMLALERVRAREGGDAMLDELCATVVSWGWWRRAAFVASHPWGIALGVAGLSEAERAQTRRVVDAYGAEVRLENRRRVLERFRLERGMDAAFVPAERRSELPPFVLPGPAGDAPPGERWEAGDELVLLPQATDGSSLGTLALAEPHDGRRPADAAAREHLRIVLQLAALTGEIVLARQRSKDLARDEARRVLSVVESLSSIGDIQALLDRLAEASAAVAGYRVAVLSVHLPVGSMLGAYNLPAHERKAFLESMAATPLERRLEKRERIRAFAYPGTGVAYVPHDADLARSAAFSPSEHAPVRGTWHAEDRLFVLVRGGAGKEIGVLSLDEPLDGNAPTPRSLGPLRLAERVLALGGTLLHNRLFEIDLRRSEEEFRSLVDGAPVGIYRRTDEHEILSANPRIAEIFGYESPEALMADPDFYAHLDAKGLEAARRAIREAGEIRGFEMAGTRRDGTPIRLRITARRHADRGFVQGVVEDVTDARRLEENLQRAQRIEALGTLASGIAHDFNNLLAGMLGYAALLKARLEREPDLARMAKAIEDSAQRAAALTRELLGVARSGPGEGTRADVEAALADCARVSRETFDRRIEVVLDLPPDLPPVACDPVDLHRAVLNMCINARDAMPEGGTLRLAAGVDAAGPRAKPGGPPGPWVRVDVEDTGHGMDAETQERIFEPFFTTKPREKGTGLGLYTAYKVVAAYGGAIEVDSRPGAGTRFRAYLRALPRLAPSREPGAPAAPPPAPGRRVLLVEDEAMVRSLASQVLASDGLVVEEAVDGEQAVRFLEDPARRYDLVVLDLVLPRMNGTQVFRRLQALRPGLPVVLSSGNVEDGLRDPAMRAGVAGVLPKPYLPDALLSAVRGALAKAGPA
jgi:PAS domain S-box-containing protein